jgi:hypothetical protein
MSIFLFWFFFQKRVFQFTKQQSNKKHVARRKALISSLAFFSACPKLLKSWRCCLSLSFVANLLVSLSSPKAHRNSNDFTSCLLSFLPQSSPERTPKERKKETKMQNHQSCAGPLVKETKRSQLGQEALKERKRERERERE